MIEIMKVMMIPLLIVILTIDSSAIHEDVL